MSTTPASTSAMPAQRRPDTASCKNAHDVSGTSTCTTLIKPNATPSGRYRSTYNQLTKLRMYVTIPPQVQSEASASTPSHDVPAAVVAPFFTSSSDAVTSPPPIAIC